MTTAEAAFGGVWVRLDENTPVDEVAARVSSASVLRLLRAGLVLAAALNLGVGLFLVLGSSLQYHASQAASFARFRQELAAGTAPIRPTGAAGQPLPLGTPIALLEIPSLGLKVVVGEGTTAGVLADGPGHERSTVFPGGAGTSVIMGRAAAFGGPFGRLGELRPGARISVRTGVGEEQFSVVDVRRAPDVIPALASGAARLTLVTASGPSFFPSGVIWVDADATGPALAASPPTMTMLPPDERPLGTSSGALRWLLLGSVFLVVTLVGARWTWRRMGRAHAWIVFSAPVAVLGYVMADQVARLLPNLM